MSFSFALLRQKELESGNVPSESKRLAEATDTSPGPEFPGGPLQPISDQQQAPRRLTSCLNFTWQRALPSPFCLTCELELTVLVGTSRESIILMISANVSRNTPNPWLRGGSLEQYMLDFFVMTKIWKEELDPSRHSNKMDSTVNYPPKMGGLAPCVYCVRVCSFTFEFHSMEQIKTCLEYYSKKIHPSSRIDIGGADPWEVQRWFERLPMYLLEEPKRQKVIKALASAIEEFEEG